MKKKILIGLATLAIVGSLIASPACLSSSDDEKNVGSCKKLLGGDGDACVVAGYFDSGNCYTTINLSEI